MADEWSRHRVRTAKMVGAWTSLGHPSITEIFTRAGVDFIGIDLEHSTISQEQAQRIIAASHAGGAACLPRLASHTEQDIKQVLDSGADGIIVPMVSSLAEIDRIVEWSKYPPIGHRAYGVARAHGYGFDFETYVRTWNARGSLVIQIESMAGVSAAKDLLSHVEVDGAMVGPYDLSGSLGVPGKLHDSRVLEACNHVIEVCRQKGKGCGTHLIDPKGEDVAKAFDSGYTFVVLASDVFVLEQWSRRIYDIARAYRS